MDKRAIFPTIMFIMAGASFAFGIWQYIYAQKVQASANGRMAFIMTTIDNSNLATAKKKEMYAAIFKGLPSAPMLFGLDFSGSFASPGTGDSCVGEGQRSVCRALRSGGATAGNIESICGTCQPE